MPKASAYGVPRTDQRPVPVTVIRVSEPNARYGIEPIERLLLTDMAVNCTQDACRFVRYYSYRWLIERFHYTLKSGCRMEKCQVHSYERITKVLAMYAIVAWRFQWLTYVARACGSGPGSMVFTTIQWRVLYRVYYGKTPPDQPISVDEAMRMAAVLGGHSGRRRDGTTGVKAIWTGLLLLFAHVQGVMDAWAGHPDATRQPPPPKRPLAPGCLRTAFTWALPQSTATSASTGTAEYVVRPHTIRTT